MLRSIRQKWLVQMLPGASVIEVSVKGGWPASNQYQRVEAAVHSLHVGHIFPQRAVIAQHADLFGQMSVVRGHRPAVAKRAGKIIEMQELLEEVGVDVARFFFVARRTQSPLDFDMDLAKNTSEENPVYYVQYAHARICNIIKHAEERDVLFPKQANLKLLGQKEEINLIKKLLEFPDLVSKAAQHLEPHRLPTFLQELAATFHRFYHHHRVVTDDKELTNARLVLIRCTQIVLANALKLLGVSAPERM